MKNIFVSAFNIHTGGGHVLLKDFLKISQNITFLLDSRIEKNSIKLSSKKNIYVKKSIIERIIFFFFFCIKSNDANSVFISLNGLPPFFKLKSKTIIFLQNVNFTENISIKDCLHFSNLKFLFEKIWFRVGLKNCDELWVQTNTMKKKIYQYLQSNKIRNIRTIQVHVRTLIDAETIGHMKNLFSLRQTYNSYLSNRHKNIFFYPSDDSLHKNHTNLIKAFNYLNKKKEFRWKLILTISNKYLNKIYYKNNISSEVRDRIVNLGKISRKEVLKILKKCDALIFPSINESFGLPLLEACLFKKPILASNKKYIFDIIKKPNSKLLFNCFSYRSIAQKINIFITSDRLDYNFSLNPNLKKYFNAKNFLKEARK